MNFTKGLSILADSEKNSFGQGTLVAVPLLEKTADSSTEWSAVLDATDGNYIRVLVGGAGRGLASHLGRGSFVWPLHKLGRIF